MDVQTNGQTDEKSDTEVGAPPPKKEGLLFSSEQIFLTFAFYINV